MAVSSIMSLLLVSACGPAAKEAAPASAGGTEPAKQAAGNKSMYIGISSAPGSMNPVNLTDNSAIYIDNIIFMPLMEPDESFQFQPRLADSIETKDNQTYTVKLNPKVKWTDGQPVTAEDVIFTISIMGNSKTITGNTTFLSILDGFNNAGKYEDGKTEVPGVKKIDDHTLEFHTKQPTDPTFFKEQVAKNVRTLPQHVLKDVSPAAFHQAEFAQKLNVSDGAFKFVNYAKDQYVELEANKDYFLGAPKLDKLYFKIMPASNLVAQLQTGEIQMNVTGIGNIAVEDFERVKNMSNVTTKMEKPFNSQFMVYNVKTIANPKVRQAILYAINRKLMVDNLLKGEGEITDVPYTSVHPYYNKDLQVYPYDPEKAKQLLKEAGWDSSTTLRFAVPTGNKVREQSADIIAENLRAVGIKAQIQKYDFPTLLQKGRSHDFDLLLSGMVFNLDPDVSPFFQTNGPNNSSGYSSPEMDQLLQQGKNEADPAKRKVIYDQIQQLIVKDLPQVTLYADSRLKAISKKVKVGEPRVLGMFINVHEWDLE